ncbi:MAG: FixH family protein [Boseongicola sp.]|nr:FixH family protein [Boseongicola sp.]MDD9978755.1 FixH family protein [Boseongicola sp.]
MTERKLNGYHVLLIFGGAFSIIISVNMLLAVSAVKTFPGLEVRNSYVASQSFDRDRIAQDALNWTVSTKIVDDGIILRVEDENGPVDPEIQKATLGRATHVGEDQELTFVFDGNALVAPIEKLGAGNWNLRLVAIAADGTKFQRRIVLRAAK